MSKTPKPTVLHRNLAIALCYAAMMCLAIAINMIPVFLTTLSVDLGGLNGLTKEQLGRIGGITFVGVVAGVFLSGPMADRLGARKFAFGGNLLISIGLAMFGMAHSYDALLVAAFIMGSGSGILDMVLSPIISALQPDRRTSALNWLHAFYCIGAVASIFTATAALKVGIGWRTTAFCLVPVALLVGSGFAWIKFPPLVRHGEERTRLRHLVRIPYFLVALLAIFLGGATELGLTQWLPAYTEITLDFPKWYGGTALLVFSVLMAIGRISVGIMGHRLTVFQLMTICCLGSAGLFLIGCFSPWRSVALSAFIAVGLTVSCLWPTTMGIVADRFPQGGASMFGLLTAIGNFGGILMPWIVGVTADLSSLRWGLSTITLCPLLMATALLWMKRHDLSYVKVER